MCNQSMGWDSNQCYGSVQYQGLCENRYGFNINYQRSQPIRSGEQKAIINSTTANNNIYCAAVMIVQEQDTATWVRSGGCRDEPASGGSTINRSLGG